MSIILNRLQCPCFDMVWVVLSTKNSQSKIPLALVCGGGGAAKSGVKNQIQVMNYIGENGFGLLQTLETGDKLCAAISSAQIKDDCVVCVAVDGSCILYTLALDAQEKVSLTERAQFVADKKEEGGCVNCIVVFVDGQNRSCVLTAGDEGICRLWALSKRQVEASPSLATWNVVLLKEFTGHKGPVMAVSVHPTKPWMCSGSRDGTLKVWDTSLAGSILSDIQLSDGTPGGSEASKKLECRGCEFSPDGKFIYLIQSGRTGAAHLVKWSIEDSKEKGKAALMLVPVMAVMCTKVPATRLRLSASESLIGVGSSDGFVTIFQLADLKKVMSLQCHDMPVTGLSFCPLRLPIGAIEPDQKSIILSCSVDYKLASVTLNGKSRLIRTLLLLIFVAIIFGAAYLIFYVFGSPKAKLIIA